MPEMKLEDNIFRLSKKYSDFCTGIFGLLMFITHFELLWSAILPFGWIFLLFDISAELEAHHYKEMLLIFMFILLIASHYKIHRKNKRKMNSNAVRGAAIIILTIVLLISFHDYITEPLPDYTVFKHEWNEGFSDFMNRGMQEPWIYVCACLIIISVSVRLAPVIFKHMKEDILN